MNLVSKAIYVSPLYRLREKRLEIVSAFLTLIILASFYAAFVGTVNMIYALHENEMVEELRLSSLKNPEASFPYIFGIGDIIHLRLEA